MPTAQGNQPGSGSDTRAGIAFGTARPGGIAPTVGKGHARIEK
ncbi:hypothetical protein R5W23_005281 [Gemmata sp. JC673]|uniref:Uncharacterized protein n=1 Tax=Gemmata algarum TaxID=2975278 RepID=A0ABU5F7T8_9BACT|nr:hypothetical protein [Gemmata algarum]MDY3563665.1 hypothetical protein [Gemmata algarum]